MSIKRGRMIHRSHKPGGVVRTAVLCSGDSQEERERREQKAQVEAEVLARFREHLMVGVQVRYGTEPGGPLSVGLFKKVEPGPRIVVEDPVTGLPVSCCPSQVSFVETDNMRLYPKSRW